MNCRELIAFLNEYVDGTIDPAVCEEFESHLAGCQPCRVVVDNLRQTLQVCRHGPPYELPPLFRQHLHDALRRRWQRTRASGGTAEG